MARWCALSPKLDGRSYRDVVNSVKEVVNPPPRFVRGRFQSRFEKSRPEKVQLFKDADSKGVDSLVDPNVPTVNEDKEKAYPALAVMNLAWRWN
ncbi:katanin p80 WD40 repeat-containing subunit B1-like protein [Corchorus olitorius]|uniref:Katanin p80 WD40 repeat-containing subunit B1-like protein n=1 Tax=Corchorus olitorius TaxID=93759 RepID=A0A1R3JVW5_9ROSI|nr:katanin p80 WD40 repeat-containing subunit B1-like protein [Corchorus olitorius]